MPHAPSASLMATGRPLRRKGQVLEQEAQGHLLSQLRRRPLRRKGQVLEQEAQGQLLSQLRP